MAIESHQYKLRKKFLEEDTEYIKVGRGLELPTINDLEFNFVPKTDIQYCQQIAQFISRYEWLGKMGMYPTHRFVATYKGELAGVVVMDMPNAFNSSILGDNFKLNERLISRGACASWTPRGTASWLIMKSIKWMVKNTPYRLFTAYSDPEAGELGTIYQACNFHYLGSGFGTTATYFDPKRPERGWFSDRRFRSKEFYRYYQQENQMVYEVCKELDELNGLDVGVKGFYKQMAREVKARCLKKEQPPKHKYCYVLGATPMETKRLRKLLVERNPIRPYPKDRGK